MYQRGEYLFTGLVFLWILMEKEPSLKVDDKGFLCVNGERAPFKYDPARQVIEYLRRDRRGDKPVQVPLSALARTTAG